jgi:hypothetical protein
VDATMKESKKKLGTQDSRYVLIKKMIYDNQIDSPPPKQIKLRDSPVYVGIDENLTMAEELERLYCLNLQIEKSKQMQMLKDNYQSMNNAMNALFKIDQRLFKGSLVKLNEHKVFPKRMRIPTETPPINAWDYLADPPSK